MNPRYAKNKVQLGMSSVNVPIDMWNTMQTELSQLRAEVERLTAQVREAQELLERFDKVTYEVVGPYDELDSVRHAYGKWRMANPDKKP